jgi:hypothetical protein
MSLHLQETPSSKRYLHLSAYSCDNCEGPVVSGWFTVRENAISKETEIEQAGAICLSCGRRQGRMLDLGITRQFPPVEWGQPSGLKPEFSRHRFAPSS